MKWCGLSIPDAFANAAAVAAADGMAGDAKGENVFCGCGKFKGGVELDDSDPDDGGRSWLLPLKMPPNFEVLDSNSRSLRSCLRLCA